MSDPMMGIAVTVEDGVVVVTLEDDADGTDAVVDALLGMFIRMHSFNSGIELHDAAARKGPNC